MLLKIKVGNLKKNTKKLENLSKNIKRTNACVTRVNVREYAWKKAKGNPRGKQTRRYSKCPKLAWERENLKKKKLVTHRFTRVDQR